MSYAAGFDGMSKDHLFPERVNLKSLWAACTVERANVKGTIEFPNACEDGADHILEVHLDGVLLDLIL